METETIYQIITFVFITSVVGIGGKIIFDWLKNRRRNTSGYKIHKMVCDLYNWHSPDDEGIQHWRRSHVDIVDSLKRVEDKLGEMIQVQKVGVQRQEDLIKIQTDLVGVLATRGNPNPGKEQEKG